MAALRGASSGAPGLVFSTGLLTRVKAATFHSFSSECWWPQFRENIMINSTPALPLQSLEESLLHVSELLRCAAATAYETGDTLNGPKRDLAFSVVHLIGMAKTELERSLARVEVR
ncbi:hypothetical protein ALP84_00653 [Pseudomonas cichorii]|uniref:DUF3077 domain-containing protein n=2 Tax=Pseudomonas cichorii TaxID=36746 RepID=A0A3M4VH84_PSECI|nr:hypothetical protein ALP84_00653 [Pseudomonas cichorii]SDP28611.1 hypothetical protein SAMN05216599_1304 [Pseudomonas cichorii]